MRVPDDLFWYEIGLLCVVVLGSMTWPRPGAYAFGWTFRVLSRVAERPALAVGLCAALAMAGSALVALLVQWPEPRVHDEFSYLLAADTFAHGRLTNPTHLLWEHFETFHVIQQPSYASKYPPGSALLPAFGIASFGQPAVGVWMSAGLMCGAITWMLYGWLPRRWAFFGGLVAVTRFGVASYWVQSYWGGATAAAGGALVFGALARLRARPRVSTSFVLGAGLAILAFTQPYQGIVVAIPVAGVLLFWIVRGVLPMRSVVAVVLPLVVSMVGIFVGQGVYNRAVTGEVTKTPYQLHDETYAIASPLLWGEPRPEPVYRHAPMREFWTDFGLAPYLRQTSWNGFWREAWQKARLMWHFYLGPLLTLGILVTLPRLRFRRGVLLAFSTAGLLFAALLVAPYRMAHYAAPGTALLVLLAIAGLRELSVVRLRRGRVGRSLVFGIGGALSALAVIHAARHGRPSDGWGQTRTKLVEQLKGDSERDVIVVQYAPGHWVHNEWVYNEADIDGSEVAWARDMGDERNQELLDYFSGRRAWTLRESGAGPPRLEPYQRRSRDFGFRQQSSSAGE